MPSFSSRGSAAGEEGACGCSDIAAFLRAASCGGGGSSSRRESEEE
jgi:hypothetical protein